MCRRTDQADAKRRELGKHEKSHAQSLALYVAPVWAGSSGLKLEELAVIPAEEMCDENYLTSQ